MSLFGDTVIGDAVRAHPEIDIIEFTDPVMTPDVIRELQIIINQPQKSPESFPALRRAQTYLGGRLIPVLTSPHFHPSLLPILDPNSLGVRYRDLMVYAIEHHYYELLDYLGFYVPLDNETLVTDTGLLKALLPVWDDYPWFIRFFIQRGVPLPSQVMWQIIDRHDLLFLREVLNTAIIDWGTSEDLTDELRTHMMDDETFAILYQNDNWNLTLDPIAVLNAPEARNLSPGIVRILRSDSRTQQ